LREKGVFSLKIASLLGASQSIFYRWVSVLENGGKAATELGQ